jgi:hypothetical protein
MSDNQQKEKVKICHDGIVARTDRAICVSIEGEDVWFPYSQVHEVCHDPIDLHLYVTPWIAEQKGLK